MEFEFLEFWWEFCVIFRHFFVGSLELRRILWVKVTMKHQALVSHAHSLCVVFFQKLYFRFRNDFIPTA